MIYLILLVSILQLPAQDIKTLQEKLGYSKDAKLLIIHADDLGVGHSVNVATMSAYEKQGISSSSMMVPCPWFGEWASMVKDRPDLDVGIHITLTAEWKNYKWDGVLPSSEIPSLINEQGYFYDNTPDVAKYAKPEEVEKEVRAQIERALAFGVNISHLDSHMGSIFSTPQLFEVYLKIGREYKLPILLPKNGLFNNQAYMNLINEEDILINGIAMFDQAPKDKTWEEKYIQYLDEVTPGVNEILIHLAYDDSETQAIMVDHPDFGATWRQNDYNVMTSDSFKKAIKERDIHLITWGDIKKIYRQGE